MTQKMQIAEFSTCFKLFVTLPCEC